MAETVDSARCGKPECEVVTTGVCAEGHTPSESCPYYGRPVVRDLEDHDEQARTDERDASAEENTVRLASAEVLSPAEVDEFLRWRSATFVTIIGERDSGKTTLILAIYDRFLEGPFAGCLFTGSRTLIGFEKRSHLARAESGRSQPDTPHTSIGEELKL